MVFEGRRLEPEGEEKMSVIEGSVVSYEGRVLEIYSREERVMSDVYADVSYARVIEDDGSVRSVFLRSHFELDVSERRATVDATPEWKAYHATYKAMVDASNAHARAVEWAKRAEKPVAPAFPRIKRGDLVMVTGKVAGLTKGDIVSVDWAGTSKFSDAERVGVMVDGKRVYCPASKVCRVHSAEEMEAAETAAEVATAKERATVAELLVAATEKLEAAVAAHHAARPATMKVAA
jgi:ribosomal protein L24